ncbi:MAG: hypothetical protein ACR2MX_06300 [Cyclobacteriaceae bacterium]
MKKAPLQAHLFQVQVDHPVGPGPGDEQIQVISEPELSPHSQQAFLEGFPGKDFFQKDLDLVHLYTVVRLALDMYQEILCQTLAWPDKGRLYIYPNTRTGIGGSFSPEENAIHFYTMAINKKWVYSCRYFDVVAHEAGHAILHALQPGWSKQTTKTTSVVSEACCDLTALFLKLYQKDWFEEIVKQGQLKTLAYFASDYGKLLGYKKGIRNLAKPDPGITSHSMSVTFSSSIFRVLVEELPSGFSSNIEDGYMKVKELITLWLQSLVKSDLQGINHSQLATAMIVEAKDRQWSHWVDLLTKSFSQTKII